MIMVRILVVFLKTNGTTYLLNFVLTKSSLGYVFIGLLKQQKISYLSDLILLWSRARTGKNIVIWKKKSVMTAIPATKQKD